MRKSSKHRTSRQDIGIVYFHRTPTDEYLQKSHLTKGNKEQFRALFHELEKSRRQAFKETGLPVLNFDGHSQQGNTFGERLSNAIHSAFDQGYEHLIIVGNDCPQLSSEQLELAKTHILQGKSVIGPDLQGGAYLIALNRSQFDKTEFTHLPWQSPALFQALQTYLQGPHLLEALRDLNTRSAIMSLMTSVTGTLKAILNAILHCIIEVFADRSELINLSISYHFYLRPPPGIRPSKFV